jgi:hypothetical protein
MVLEFCAESRTDGQTYTASEIYCRGDGDVLKRSDIFMEVYVVDLLSLGNTPYHIFLIP